MLYSAAFIVLSYLIQLLYLITIPFPYMYLYSPYDVDKDVQLVCKYLQAYHRRDDPDGINRIFKPPEGRHMIRCK